MIYGYIRVSTDSKQLTINGLKLNVFVLNMI